MVNVQCRTNIDCCKRLEWPTHLPEVPRVGELIRSSSSTDKKYIELEVCRITWYFSPTWGDWRVEVELGMVKTRYANLPEFTKWVEGRTE